ncbi:MAG: chorismate synthase [Flavobacteriales bacterium]|nr:chorismate synthase [Flavobacteriales bacterium]MDW8433036.1 chorismate synthase [Flavobacteriales bacterium]
MNTLGHLLRLTTFGESHGPAVGGVLDGFPAGFKPDFEKVNLWNARRRPGSTSLGTRREEADVPEFLSGLQDGLTNGAPLAFLLRNTDQRPQDYAGLRHKFRPSHADFTYFKKYGLMPAPGGGRASARETAVRVTAGALALQWLAAKGVGIRAWTEQIGAIRWTAGDNWPEEEAIYATESRCPDPHSDEAMRHLVQALREKGDSIGGTVRCVVTGLPPGLGEPVYGKLTALLAMALWSINAVKGLDFGAGFEAVDHTGSALNDLFETDGLKVVTRTNHSGGIQGGISNGMPLVFRVLFKPPSTLARPQETLDLSGQKTTIEGRGRHDPCVVPRAVPVVVATTALVLMDAWLMHQARYPEFFYPQSPAFPHATG